MVQRWTKVEDHFGVDLVEYLLVAGKFEMMHGRFEG